MIFDEHPFLAYGALAALSIFFFYHERNFLSTLFPRSEKVREKLLIDYRVRHTVELIRKTIVSSDIRIFRFALPKEMVLGLPTLNHISMIINIDGSLEMKPFAPVSTDDDVGFMDIMVKIFPVHPDCPNGGMMSRYLDGMNIGQSVDILGPYGRLIYHGHGQLSMRRFKKCPPVYFLCQRIGILLTHELMMTTVLQLLRHIFKDSTDNTECALVSIHRNAKDIMLRKELESYAIKYPKRFKLWYSILDSTEEGWKYGTGPINDQMLRDHLFPPSDDTVTILMGKTAYKSVENLERIGHNKDYCQIYH